jgi:hypothetical protein
MSNSKYYDGMTSGLVELGEIRGYEWEIRVNRGNHPCAYVTIPDEHFIVESKVRDYDEVKRLCKIDVHGGLTYMSGYKIGWDYGHLGDFTYYSPTLGDHKYTHEEIMEDIERVIESLEKADKPYQAKRKVDGLLREIGKIYIEQIERSESDETITAEFFQRYSDDAIYYNWFGGQCKLNKDGKVKISVNFTFNDSRGISLYKRDIVNTLKSDMEWHKKRLEQLEKQLKEL